jgi:hypothetical protein
MARMHAFMAKSGKNIATLPNSKIGMFQKPKSILAPRAKLPLRRAEGQHSGATTPSRRSRHRALLAHLIRVGCDVSRLSRAAQWYEAAHCAEAQERIHLFHLL